MLNKVNERNAIKPPMVLSESEYKAQELYMYHYVMDLVDKIGFAVSMLISVGGTAFLISKILGG